MAENKNKLTNTQVVLKVLQDFGQSLTTKQVSEKTKAIKYIRYSNISQYLNELEKDGMITRKTIQISNKPYKEVHLTKLGKEIDVIDYGAKNDINEAIDMVKNNHEISIPKLDSKNEINDIESEIESNHVDTGYIPRSQILKLKNELRQIIHALKIGHKSYETLGFKTQFEAEARMNEIIDLL